MNIRRGVNFDDFDKGYEMGKLEGYDVGFEVGHSEGEDYAMKEFKKDESDSGFDMGRIQGFADGLRWASDVLDREVRSREQRGLISHSEARAMERVSKKCFKLQNRTIRDYKKHIKQ